jgi:exonuclease III
MQKFLLSSSSSKAAAAPSSTPLWASTEKPPHRIGGWNANGLGTRLKDASNTAALEGFLNEQNLDVLCITETWLKRASANSSYQVSEADDAKRLVDNFRDRLNSNKNSNNSSSSSSSSSSNSSSSNNSCHSSNNSSSSSNSNSNSNNSSSSSSSDSSSNNSNSSSNSNRSNSSSSNNNSDNAGYNWRFSCDEKKKAGTCVLISKRLSEPAIRFTMEHTSESSPNNNTANRSKQHHDGGRVIVLQWTSILLLMTYAPNNGGTEESLKRREAWDEQVARFLEFHRRCRVR